jgi:protein TonB
VGTAAGSPEVRRGNAAQPPPLGGDVRPPKLIKSNIPTYPALARTQRVSGDVQVDALVDTTGKVGDLKILSGPLLLQRAALDAITQWKYTPGMLDGVPTPMHVTVVLKFRIPNQ